MFQQQRFTHHGHPFTIEAEGWPNEHAASAAIIDLQTWALSFNPEQTATLYRALRREAEALVHETAYDRDAAPLPSVRAAQRNAVLTGLQGNIAGPCTPTVSIEAVTQLSTNED